MNTPNSIYYIAIDFIGTLIEKDEPVRGSPIELVIELLKQRIKSLSNQGYIVRVILWSCLDREELQVAKIWCEDHGIDIYSVNSNPDIYNTSPKIVANEYWDSRGLNPFMHITLSNVVSGLDEITEKLSTDKTRQGLLDARIMIATLADNLAYAIKGLDRKENVFKLIKETTTKLIDAEKNI